MAAHVLASIPNGLILEMYPSMGAAIHDIVPRWPVIDGSVEISESPGLGIELDEDAVKRYGVR